MTCATATPDALSVYGARVHGAVLVIDQIIVSAGLNFFDEFRRFGGNVQNKKLQIRLPVDFFRME
jgi:hypothetical protein